jgi:tryptophan synthase alpha chain
MKTPCTVNTLGESFGRLRAQKRMGLVPFVAGGFPELAALGPALTAMGSAANAELGVAAIEVGFPFSDPIADGPTIQAAFTEALAAGVTVGDIFKSVAEVRPMVHVPLVAMVSYSIVYRWGVGRFCREAKAAGFGGLIVPDLPPPEAEAVCDQVRGEGLDTVLLVAPTTREARRAEITNLCSGFVYYLSVTGITGERDGLPADLAGNIAGLRKLTDKPICVGFGIHQARQVADLARVADGAIVGSAIVKRMKENREKGPAAVAAVVGEYCRQLLGQ